MGNLTKAEEEAIAREEYRKAAATSNGLGLFGGGFWTLVVGTIVAGIFGAVLKNSESMQKWVGETFGLEGQMFIDGIFSALGMDPIYGTQIESAFMEMETDKAVDMIKGRLGQTEVIIGNHMLKELLKKGENRDITFKLLKTEGFSFEKPELSNEKMLGALKKAIEGTVSLENVTPERLKTYTDGILNALTTDIKEIKADKQKQNIGLITTVKDTVTNWFSKENVDRSAQSIASDPAFMKVIIAAMPEKVLEYVAASDDSAEFQAFIKNQQNRDAILKLLETVPADQISAITGAFFNSNKKDVEGNAMTPASITELLNNPDLVKTFKENRQAIKDFLNGVDTSTLPAEQKIAHDFLITVSPESGGKTNFDILADLADSPEAAAAVTKVIEKFSSGQLKGLSDVKISPEAHEAAFNALQDLELSPKIKAALLSNSNTAIYGGTLTAAETLINENGVQSAVATLNQMIKAVGVDLTLDPDVAKSIRESEQDDSLDMVLNVVGGSMLKEMSR